jgi:serine O-acetyltransferase
VFEQSLVRAHGADLLVPDWSAERKRFTAWDPGRSLIATIRCYERNPPGSGLLGALLRNLSVFRHRFWSAVSGADIPLNTKIGGGLRLPHPNGIVIHPSVAIGPNCLIFQQVTIGANFRGTPKVGANVDFGAGAKVLGPIVIGDHAIIGANSVVLRDVAPGTIVAGIPARLIAGRNEESMEDRKDA